MTINIGGNREALFLAMESDADILLVAKHRLDGLGLQGVQAAVMGAGWRGIWDPAIANDLRG